MTVKPVLSGLHTKQMPCVRLIHASVKIQTFLLHSSKIVAVSNKVPLICLILIQVLLWQYVLVCMPGTRSCCGSCVFIVKFTLCNMEVKCLHYKGVFIIEVKSFCSCIILVR